MSKYCTRCGRRIPDGAICVCRIRRTELFATKEKENGVAFRKILRPSDPDYDQDADYYERGKQIVPELVASSENEIPIKQYHLMDVRSRLRGLWAEGRLMITNKRILFRASGRSFIGRTLTEQEYALDEISGIVLSRGVRFSLFDLILSLFLCQFFSGFAYISFITLETKGWWILPLLFALIGLGAMFFVGQRRYRWKMIISCFIAENLSVLSMGGNMHGGFGTSFFAFLAVIAFLAALAFLILSSMKPVVSLMIQCKSGTSAAVAMISKQIGGIQVGTELLPTEETDIATREVGAIIYDIQHMGDYGIEKWKPKEQKEELTA